MQNALIPNRGETSVLFEQLGKAGAINQHENVNLFELKESVDDLAELLYLVNDLNQTANNANNNAEEGWLDSHSRRTTQILEAKYQRYLELIEQANTWGKSDHLIALEQTVRQDYLSIKSVLRLAYQKRGTTMCLSDWQSPSYLSSIELGNNRLNEGTSEHLWNYKRDGHLDALKYENRFISEYAHHLQSDRLAAYLANSHMASLTTVLQWLAHEMELGRTALVLQPVHFETLNLTRAFFPNARQLQAPNNREDVLACLRKESPTVVICETISTEPEVLASQIDVALDWACHEAQHEVALVFDTSALPMAQLPQALLKEIPQQVSILFIEDLSRHHQFGLDTVPGGMVIAHMNEKLHESFRNTRARLGTNVTDTSVGSLPRPNRQALVRRLDRHSKNVSWLAQQLDRISRQPASVYPLSLLARARAKQRFRPDIQRLNPDNPFEPSVSFGQLLSPILWTRAGISQTAQAFGLHSRRLRVRLLEPVRHCAQRDGR